MPKKKNEDKSKETTTPAKETKKPQTEKETKPKLTSSLSLRNR